MQSNITLHKIKRVIKTSALAFGFLSLFSLANAQTYENGPLSTGATSSNGTAAPAGTTWSEVQNPNTNAGFGANITAGLTVADNFTVCGSWALSKITFYAYSTGFTGTVSPFNDVRLRIYNTDPSVGSPAPIFGDLTTNRFLASNFANMYRIFNATPGTTRKIWTIEATVNTTLPSGTYWLEWQLGNGGLSNFSPAVTIVGAATQTGWNAKQNTLPNTWVNLVDGTPAAAQDMPFKIDYTSAACTGTPAPGNTIASVANACPGGVVSLSLQNCTPGSGVTYQWQSATALAGPYTNITGATGTTYSTSLTATTFYRAVATCGGNAGTSTPVQVTLNPPSACYCVPGATNCTLDDEILNVRFGSLNNSSSGCTGSGYTDYTALAPATNVFIGVANPMTVTIGPGGNDNVGVWIDYNSNGTFDASEFTLLGSAATGAINGTITVPTTVTAGTYRMRVRVKFTTPVLTGTQACAAYTYGETEDYRVTIAPCVTSSVTTQPPAATTISCSGTGTITATVAGSLNQYQWQVLATGAGAVWTDLTNNANYSGVTTNVLTITNALPTINGYQYRVRYVGACTSPSVTTASTLTVGGLVPTVSNTLPINRCTTAPATAISIATPVGLAALSTTASGTLHTNIPDNNDETIGQNDRFISNNLTVANIPAGATITGFNVKLNITHSWVGDLILVLKAPNGKIINLDYALSGTGGAAASTAFTNTVISSTGTKALSAGTNPYSETFRLDNAGPSTAGFTPTGPLGFNPNTTVLADMYQGNGTWTLALYDYYRDNTTTNFLENWELNISYLAPPAAVFTPVTGLFTDPAGTIAYVAGTPVNTVYANPAASTTYSATVNTAVCGAGTVSIPVNVGSPLSGTSTVDNKTGCIGGSVTFSSTAPTGGLNATFQWQVSTDAGATWTNIAGATSATYTATGLTAAMTGTRYRVVRTVASCTSTLTSSAGTLTVAPRPTLNISASNTALYPGQTTTIAVASTTTVPANGYTWTKDGVVIPNQTTSSRVVGIDDLGVYTVQVVDANGCSAVAVASIEIKAAANDILFIYPNPSNGQFQVRYFSEFGSTVYPRLLSVYDMKGAKVFTKSYSINSPYTRMDVDMTNHGRGVYQVELTDNEGKRIKVGRVLVH